jgi:ABC-type transporter Mla subunit MlaD
MQPRSTVIFITVLFFALCLSNCADETKIFYVKCPRSSLSKYSKVSVNGFQVGNVTKVISKPTNNFDVAKIVLSDKNCITDSSVLVMSKNSLLGEYEIHVKRSNKGKCLTWNDTVSVVEEKTNISKYVDTAATLKVLDKVIDALDTVRSRIRQK